MPDRSVQTVSTVITDCDSGLDARRILIAALFKLPVFKINRRRSTFQEFRMFLQFINIKRE